MKRKTKRNVMSIVQDEQDKDAIENEVESCPGREAYDIRITSGLTSFDERTKKLFDDLVLAERIVKVKFNYIRHDINEEMCLYFPKGTKVTIPEKYKTNRENKKETTHA